MSSPLHNFIETSINSTPLPKASSTVDRRRLYKTTLKNTTEERNLEESLGVLSIKSDDLSFSKNLHDSSVPQDAQSYLELQRSLANKSLQQRQLKVLGIPSKYLRPSDLTHSTDTFVHSMDESTVNESDLLKSTPRQPSNTSTPRSSASPSELGGKMNVPKFSLGESMSKLFSYDISNSNMSLSTAFNKIEGQESEVHSSMSQTSGIFTPAENAVDRLLLDEASWQREHVDIPVEQTDFDSLNISNHSKLSIGEFFKQRSEDISNIICQSSRSTFSLPLENESILKPKNDIKDSLSVTQIAKLLSNNEGTPTKLLNFFCEQENGKPKFELNKENIDLLSLQDKSIKERHSSVFSEKSLSSARSASSLGSLPNGKLPIESTHGELIWGCIKPGKTSVKSFSIRNKTPNRIKLQCTVTGRVFKLVPDHSPNQDYSNSIKYTLHSYEVKNISVVFCPISDGAATDEIMFTSLNPTLKQTKKQSVRLFAYGGTSNVEFGDNIIKDTSGKFWLSLGKLLHKPMIEKILTLQNTGSLSIFAIIDFIPRDSFTFLRVNIVPSKFVLKSREKMDVTISYSATNGDISYIQNSLHNLVVDMGVLKIVSGAEVTRGRIKRLCEKAVEKKLGLDDLSLKLIKNIPGECEISNLQYFKESLASTKSLLQDLNQREVILTLEQDLDHTLMPVLPDETSMFQTLWQDNSALDDLNLTVIDKRCKLEPSELILTPPHKTEDLLFLISDHNETLHFNVSVPDCFKISPTEGDIKPKATVVLKLSFLKLVKKQNVFNVVVNISKNEILQTVVKIIVIN